MKTFKKLLFKYLSKNKTVILVGGSALPEKKTFSRIRIFNF